MHFAYAKLLAHWRLYDNGCSLADHKKQIISTVISIVADCIFLVLLLYFSLIYGNFYCYSHMQVLVSVLPATFLVHLPKVDMVTKVYLSFKF